MNNAGKTKHNTVFIERIGLIVALVGIVIVFSLINGNYLSMQNLLNILSSASLVGLVAIGESYLIIAGLIDLSPGSLAAFSSVLAGLLISWGVHYSLVIPLIVIVGLCIGFLNGMGYNKLRLEPFIVTLSAMSIFRGLAYILCGGRPVAITDMSFNEIGSQQFFGFLNVPIITMIIAFFVFGIILSNTTFGRSVYVLGGNKYAARLAGIDARKITTLLFMISAGLSSLGGGLLAARMQSAQPSASTGLEFEAITASVLGGVAMSGGVGGIGGAVLGVFILQCFNTGLIMSYVPTYWQQTARGILLLLALAFDFYRRRQYEKGLLLKTIQESRESE